MSTFINVDLERTINHKYFKYHLIFFLNWLLIIGVFVFRLDSVLLNFLPESYEWVGIFVPILVFTIVYFSIRNLRWYYWLGFFFYIPLMLFWFVPKLILQKGKLYLFISYISILFRRITRWKSSLLHFIALFTIVILLIYSPNEIIRGISILFATYLLIRYNYRYAKKSIRPISFFGKNLKKELKNAEDKKEKQYKNLEKLIKNVDEKGMSPEEIEIKKISNIANYHAVLETVKDNLSSSKGKSAFLIYWLITFAISVLGSVLVLAFINYQIYLIDNDSFRTMADVNFGEFIRYTLKSLTYGDIDEIKPNNALTKILEGGTFFIIGVLYLMILLGFGYSFRNSKIEEETEIIVKVMDRHLEIARFFIQEKFDKDYYQITNEVISIKDSVNKIKLALERLF